MKTLSTDVVIIGAGPVGLFQVFELGLQGLSAIVVESLEQIGGQCSELYPDKPIYDIPALPNASAADIIDNLWQQAKAFEPKVLLAERVETINKLSDNSFTLFTSRNRTIYCRAVIIAAGNGAFSPVKLKLAKLEPFEDKQVFYRVNSLEQFRDKNVVVLGGGDSALDWSLCLQPVAQSVVLIHRSTKFRAAQHSVEQMFSLCQQLKMQFLTGQVSDIKQVDGKLTALLVNSKDGVTRTVALDRLLVCFGMSPKLGPIEHWSLKMHQRQILVNTQTFQSSVDGIYAVGDINYYPGKRKLILSGFHEAALAAFAIAEALADKKRIPTLYTTTSTVLHQRIGVRHSLASLMDG